MEEPVKDDDEETGPDFRRGVVAYKTNPFMPKLVQMKTRHKRVTVVRDKAVVDTNTGEVEDIAEVVQVRTVDAEEFVKLYTSNLKDFFNLSPAAFKLVQVVMKQCQKAIDGDVILMNAEMAKDYFTATDQAPMSRATYFRALKELLQKKFIAKNAIGDNLYFINPTLFFNGDRVRFVKEYVRKQSAQGDLFEQDTRQALPEPTPEET